jgi:hypothetical protein
MRSALGAGRARLARQLAAESVVLAAVAAAGGLLLAEGFIRLLRVQAMSQDPFVAGRIELNAAVAVFTIATATTVALLCNLVPLVRLARSSPLWVFATRDMAPPARARYVLLAGQVAVAVAFLAIAGLLVHSITRLNAGDRGYAPDGITSIRLRAPLRVQGNSLGELYRQYLEQLRAIPGIASVAMASPLLPLFPATNFVVDQTSTDAATLSAQRAAYTIVSPDYFATMKIRVLAGRSFIDDDRAGRPPVAIVNEEMAQRFFQGQSVVGRQLRAGEGPRSAHMIIVGVVANVRPAMQLEPMPQVYVSYLQQAEPSMSLLVGRAESAAVRRSAASRSVVRHDRGAASQPRHAPWQWSLAGGDHLDRRNVHAGDVRDGETKA